MNKTTYPQYRKYANNKVYFKIISKTSWEEVHHAGKRYTLHHFDAKILPDRNFLHDMTYEYENNWQKIDADEYELIKTKCANQ
jgi:hypothetical protein